MKVLKTIGIILVVLAALIVIAGLLMPSKFHSERSLVINAPQEQIFDQVNTVKNWDNWSAWNKMDPNWKVDFSEVPSGPGAWYSWKSENKNVGEGKITITKSEPYSLVEATMEMKGMGGPAKLTNKFEPVEGGVKVTLSIDSDLGSHILNKLFMGLFGDKMVGGNYEKSLQNMQEYLKSHPAPAPTPEPAPAAPSHDSAAAPGGNI